MKITTERKRWNTANDRLRRARNLYARFVYRAVMDCPLEDRDRLMDNLTQKALDHGLWKATTTRRDGSWGGGAHREVRYSLLSRFRKMTPGYERDGFAWHRWLRDFNWHGYTWRTCRPAENEKAG